MTKNSHWRTLTLEHDQNMDEFDLKYTNKKIMKTTNLNMWILCWCGHFGQVPQPQLANSHWLGHLPSLTLLLYKKKKTSGTDYRRTQDVKLRFVGFKRFVSFNFGQIQLLRFVVVMVRSNSFGHLDLVKWITLKINIYGVF